jgi:nucleoporin p58/p45
LKGYELIKGATKVCSKCPIILCITYLVLKDFVNCNTNIRHDLHFMRDLKAKVDRAVEDTIIATRIVDGFKNPQSSGGGGYLKEHANFPFE